MGRHSQLALAGGAVLVCAALLLSMRSGTATSELLDKEAAEIAELKTEKEDLEHTLKTGRAPLLHPNQLKLELRRAAQLKSTVEKGRQWAAKSAPPPAPVQSLSQTHPSVQKLKAEREALQHQIEALKMKSGNQVNPFIGGILASFPDDSTAGVLSRASTIKAANTGLLGRVGEDSSDNVLGSLAATMSTTQQAQMLEAEHIRQLDNEAKAMGDVSPKEALAQRIIALGAQFLSEKDEPPQHVKVDGPSSSRVTASQMHARGRIAKLHSRLSRGREVYAGTLYESPTPAAHATSKDSGLSPHAKAVLEARKRVELLRKELREAERVAKLKAELHSEQTKLTSTNIQAAHLNTQSLKAAAPKASKGAQSKFEASHASISAFLGEKPAAEEDDTAEDEDECDEDDEGCKMQLRFEGKAHGEGYVKHSIYVGTANDEGKVVEGPDRYGQDGAGPQVIKGKLGDNIVDLGLYGAAGTIEGDVMVPTRLAGVRRRDVGSYPDAKKMRLGHVDEETSNEVVKGTLLDDFGGEKGLQLSDQEVPLGEVQSPTYRDRVRTEALSQSN